MQVLTLRTFSSHLRPDLDTQTCKYVQDPLISCYIISTSSALSAIHVYTKSDGPSWPLGRSGARFFRSVLLLFLCPSVDDHHFFPLFFFHISPSFLHVKPVACTRVGASSMQEPMLKDLPCTCICICIIYLSSPMSSQNGNLKTCFPSSDIK